MSRVRNLGTSAAYSFLALMLLLTILRAPATYSAFTSTLSHPTSTTVGYLCRSTDEFANYTGLYRYYRLDDAGGSTATDSSGNNVTATYKVTSTAGQQGTPNTVNTAKSVIFSENNYLNIPLANNGWMNGAPYTISLWFKPGTNLVGDYQRIWSLEKSFSPSDGMSLQYTKQGRVLFGARKSTDSSSYVVFETPAPAAWTLYTLTFDGTKMRLYLNETQVMEHTPSRQLSSTTRMYLGAEAVYGSSMLNGQIDNFSAWNRALSASEVSFAAKAAC